MRFRQLLIGAILVVSFEGAAGAEEVDRVFVGRSLSFADSATTDFPLAPEAKSDSVNELVALLDRVRKSGRERRVVVRSLTLDEVVRLRNWREQVSYQLGRRFP